MIFSFSTCGGLSNQVLSISYAVTFAIAIGVKGLVLPNMLLDGRQIEGVGRFPESATDEAFSRIFDSWRFSQILRSHGIELVDTNFAKHSFVKFTCRNGEPLTACLAKAKTCKKKSGRCLLHMECPFLHNIWNVNFLEHHLTHFDSIFYGLKLSPALEKEYQASFRDFRRRNRISCITMIHARIEDDWHKHCQSWRPNLPKNYNYDCMVDIFSIFRELEQHEIAPCPIYLAYDTEDVSARTKFDILKLKRTYKVPVFDWHDLNFKLATSREIRAATQFSMSQDADYFFGNTVSTLSAVIQRGRRKEGRWTSQYNIGFNPLSEFVPGYSIPWVFTLSRSHDANYDLLMKAAVRSAREKTSLIPICMVHADEDRQSSRIKWLMRQGVRIVYHRPLWDTDLLDGLRASTSAEKKQSHLYADADMVLSTYFRLDIPIVPEIYQFEHVLYTDTDVYFRKDITNLQGVGWRLPDSIQMGYEAVDMYPLNAGIYLASTRFLRATHHSLIQRLIKHKRISYAEFGPGDQGLLNMMYAQELKLRGPLDKALNAKAYHAFSSSSAIVHFHGPKPVDYLTTARSNNCTFGDMCARGLKRGFCQYFLEWIEYVEISERGLYEPLEARCRR